MAASMIVLNVTPARIHLHLDNPDGYTIEKLMRVDANGTRTVRTLSGQLPSTATSIDFYDYEYALAAEHGVAYYVYNTANTVLAIASWFSTPDDAHVLAFGVPLYPSNGLTLSAGGPGVSADASVSFALSWSSKRDARTTLHDVIGRSDPVPVLRPVGTRAGDLTLICPDHATCELIENQLSLPYVFQLRQSDVPGFDAYFAVTSLSASNVPGSKRWQLVVGVQEIAWPPGSFVASNVWTYADVWYYAADYNGLAASFANYADLLDKLPVP